jgi:hypothetical protein
MVSNGATAVLEKALAMAPFSNLLPLGLSFSLKPDFLLLSCTTLRILGRIFKNNKKTYNTRMFESS